MNGILKYSEIRLFLMDTWQSLLGVVILLIFIVIITRIAIALDRAHFRQWHLDKVAVKEITERDILIEEQAKKINEQKKEINCLNVEIKDIKVKMKGAKHLLEA